MFIGLRKQHTNFDNCVWLTDVSHSFLARYFPIVLPLWNESPVGYLKPVAIVIMHVAKYSMTSQLKRSYSWFYHRRRSKHSWHCNLIRGYFSFLSQCWANALSIQVVSAFISFVHFVGRRPWQRAWTKEVPENVFKAISAEFRCIVTSWKCKHLQILWLHFAWTENSRHSRYIE